MRSLPIALFTIVHTEDEIIHDRLKIELRPLERDGSIELLNENLISVGADKNSELKSMLERSNYFLIAVTPRLLASDHHFEVISSILKSHKKQVIIFIAKPCAWRETEVHSLVPLICLPPHGDPSWDESWLNLSIKIRTTLGLLKSSHDSKNLISNNYLDFNRIESFFEVYDIDDFCKLYFPSIHRRFPKTAPTSRKIRILMNFTSTKKILHCQSQWTNNVKG